MLRSLVTIICPPSWDVGEWVVAWVRLHGHQIRFKNPEKGGKKKEARKGRNADWKRKETTNEEK